MTKEEASIKMAELCEKVIHLGYPNKIYIEGADGVCDEFWNPEENFEQIHKVLEKLKSKWLTSWEVKYKDDKEVFVWLYGDEVNSLNWPQIVWSGSGETLAQAIFSAVHKWMQAEGER